ncbi:amidohydrolase family protein [Edaphobacter modestus]|uniref:Imidazolonepropionase-like amidohydrolase n=1 Tax=Edaphobacter modestus TaxID=388466 RepID=A0A4Q7YTF9_9BACT|nr:amidohydrolase family protein [Edaphobacter modestus]RZU40564.1 imidazolonepropionase-like amidohydrolase [Edaphobacter modestus]
MLLPSLRIMLLFAVAPALAGQAQTVTVITGARVVDGTGAPARVETVVIRDNRIVSVSDHAEIPADAHVIDATGQTLLPGLFDLHTHLNSSATNAPDDFGKSLKMYLLCGVTSVNDYSVYGEMLAPLRSLQNTGVLPGPKVNFAIRLGTPQGHGTEFGWGDFFTQMVSTPAEAHAAMKRILPYKPDVIKVFTDGWRYGRGNDLTSMNLETLSAIVHDAHSAGLKVFTHTVTLAGAKIAARAGVDVLAHGVGDAPVDDELISLLKTSGTGYVSTLATYEPAGNRTPAPHLTALLSPGDRQYLSRASERQEPPSPDSPAMRRWHLLQENVQRLSQAGIPIGVGTDAGVAGTYHGWSTLHEMELLVASGLTPLQAITAATGTSAQLVGEGERGTIEPGKIADLLLVKGLPDRSIGDIENTEAVFLSGKQLDLRSLEAAIQSPEMTPLPAHPIPALIDDAERTDSRTNLDTMLVNSTDTGVDHSQILFTRSFGKDAHDLSILARMSPKPSPFADLVIPLTKGGVELADISAFKGIRFQARGSGSYRVLLESYGMRRSTWYAASFTGDAKWRTVRIPFSAFHSTDTKTQLPLRRITGLHFELAAAQGNDKWLNLDNLKLY